MSTQTSSPPAGILTLDPKGSLEKEKTLYTLYYRQGNNPHPQFTFFHLPMKDMQQVTLRVKRFCDVMNYRFVYVKPAIIDLDREENIFFQEE